MDYLSKIKSKLELLPLKPGCYLMKDETGKVIYVGKAKKLKNRVSSYFNGTKYGKTKILVSNIRDFEYIVTSSEKEALLLEINLIKKYDPKYNIIFRDDKQYPYIALEYKNYPKLSVLRPSKKYKNKDIKLFGPYPNSGYAKKIVEVLNRIYPLQKCKNFKSDLCLYYHIGECLGYCKLDIPKEIMDNMVNEITNFLNGDFNLVIDKLTKKMNAYSERMDYENAKEIKELIDYLKVVLSKQKIDLNDRVNRDIFNYFVKDDFISIQVLHYRNGSLVERKSNIYEVNDDPIDSFMEYIISFYEDNTIPKEIFVPDDIDNELLSDALNTKVLTPIKGTKKKLLDMAYENAKIGLLEKEELVKRNISLTIKANEELSTLIGKTIHRIESFDNSHLFGDASVSAMVVYIDGKKCPKEYRKYKIKTGSKDDFHMMQEVLERRYSRVITDNLIAHDLILVDGGIIQVHAAEEILDNLGLDILVLGMQKNDKHKICALVDTNGVSYEIEKNSNLFHLLENISEEVHRFVISFHRDLRSKGSLSSILDNIEDVGTKRRNLLIKKYKTVNKIKETPIEELEDLIGKKAAKNVKDALKEN